MLLEENELMNQQLSNYEQKVDFMSKIDSLKSAQIIDYELLNKSYVKQIDDLNTAVKKKNKAIMGLKIGCITVSVGLVLLLILR